jgi:glycosyltransferase involved in cell wall biosynthesis
MKILIALPARNEERNIGGVLSQILQMYAFYDVVVVDDASSDRTAAIVATFPTVKLIQLPFWMGYGGALQTAYKYALHANYDAVVQLDADGQHDPAFIQKLIDHLQHADLVVGSRFLVATYAYRMPWIRRVGCYALSVLARMSSGIRITDPTSGFQALNLKALQLATQDHYPMDYPDIDVLMLMHRFHLKVSEIPVQMHPADDTNMHAGIQVWYYGIKMLLSMIVMMMRRN